MDVPFGTCLSLRWLVEGLGSGVGLALAIFFLSHFYSPVEKNQV